MKELIKPVVNDEEEVVVQALCETNNCSNNCNGGTNSSIEDEDEIVF
ncbi:MAG: hypothetical protein LBC40_05370 [Dysgonamonadaceae bacterium]|jgi:hypothetical protein|nr:hypothetical protein [Dysgonamonadaceae bacterium]